MTNIRGRRSMSEVRYDYEHLGSLWSRGMPSEIYMSECEPLRADCVECGIPLLFLTGVNLFLCGNCGRESQYMWIKELFGKPYRSEKPKTLTQYCTIEEKKCETKDRNCNSNVTY